MTDGDGQAHYFLIGIGGMGMTPLACYLAQSGCRVSGWDDGLAEPARRLLDRHQIDPECFRLPPDVTGVVYSSAVSPGHPLRVTTRRRSLPEQRRGACLAALLGNHRVLAVAGSHGKTTTTALIAHGLARVGKPANVLYGGFPRDPEGCPGLYHPRAEWTVTELDESDGTLEAFRPAAALILNLDWDHPDHYPDAGAYRDAFRRLADRTTETLLLPEGLNLAAGMPAGEGPRIRRFPRGHGVDRANLAAAEAALTLVLGERPPAGWALGFQGVRRRQGVLLEGPDCAILEDYAHHPAEIEALFEWARQRFPGRTVLPVFQAHRLSRTERLAAELASVFAKHLQDQPLRLLPLYGAFEAGDAAAVDRRLVSALEAGGVRVLPEKPDPDCWRSLDDAVSAARVPVVVVFIGAGSIERAAAAYTAWRGAKNPADAWYRFTRTGVSPECQRALDEPLHTKTTLRVGGPATAYAEPACLSDLRFLRTTAGLFGWPVFMLGRGSNLIVADDGFPGLVIRLQHAYWHRLEPLDERHVTVGAGARLKDVCLQAGKLGLTGFEFLEGIPGSIGGALRMNAGAMGSWMFDIVASVLVMDATGQVSEWSKDAFTIGYRRVNELVDAVAVAAVLTSPGSATRKAIRETVHTYMQTRRKSQPRDPSAGCIFKNPEGGFAGQLVDAAGLKGQRVGDAEVSETHANFIINTGQARAADVIALVNQIRQSVYAGHGIVLEPEALLLGADWDAVLEPLQPEAGNPPLSHS
ncbi:MAG: UDP-N-acetylmuramate dehydrogenase [Opitutales bacterium]